jgi:Fe-S oxidoreductase
VSDHFVEMENHGVANICCGGGGGVSTNPRAEDMRIKAFACKKAQVDDLGGVDAMVTACGNCRNVLEEAIDAYGMELPVLGLTEFLAEYLDDDNR